MRRFALVEEFHKWLRDAAGVAAVEFAIAIPVVVFGFVMMTDVGLALHERMNLDQAVRAGAEFVWDDVTDETDLQKLMIASATGRYSDTPSTQEASERPTVQAVRWCECPDNPGTTVNCNATLCASTQPPSIYYTLSASKTYSAILLPDFNIQTKLDVQIR